MVCGGGGGLLGCGGVQRSRVGNSMILGRIYAGDNGYTGFRT